MSRCSRYKTCRAFAICWAAVGTVGLGYFFLSSTIPITTLGDPPEWGPAWVGAVAVTATLLLGLPWLAVPGVLLIVGLIQMHWRGRARWWWQLCWAVLVAVAFVIELMVLTGYDVPFLAPNYQGAAIVAWIWLGEIGGCLLTGVAMLAVLTRAGSARRLDTPA